MQKITPTLMFVGKQYGKAEEAINFYSTVFHNANVGDVLRYNKYGVSWQIVPTIMEEMLKDKDKEKLARVTEAFLKMKKFDIKVLMNAYKGGSGA
jgi:predicted 3-demethylubiquinone-9 3-methyltransferase (glyoxalase superfamily)